MTDYDEGATATLYRQAKDWPWRARIEAYSLLRLIGDVTGKKVLDAACGEGHYTRLIRRAGASEVIGLDISARMIELARAEERQTPLGIGYLVEDAATIVPQHDFDLVVAVWLFVYARDRGQLLRMCQGLASRLRPGGRLISLIGNPELGAQSAVPDYREFGFEMRLPKPLIEGAPVRCTLYTDGGDLEIENYYMPIEAYEQAFAAAGFRGFATHPLELSPHPQGIDDRAYWRDLLDNPIGIILEALR